VATLLITDEDGGQRRLDLTGRDVRIGRSSDNDLVLGDAGKGVSRMHAELRYEQGRYVIIDLNSQNGTWVNGERVQRGEVPPGAEVAIGAYRLKIDDVSATTPAPTAGETQIGQMAATAPAPAMSPSGTMMAPPRAAEPAAPPAKAAKKAKRPAAPGAVEKPGAIAALARLPKPLIFGGFFAIVLVIIVLGQVMAPAPATPGPGAKPAGAAGSDGASGGESNAQIIARHLTEGKALVDKGEYEAAIRDHFDRILLIDANHAEASDLKAKAEEKLQQQQAAAAAAAAAPPAADAAPAAASTIPAPGGAASASTVPPPSASTVPAPSAPAATPPARAAASTVAPPAASLPSAPPKAAAVPAAPAAVPAASAPARGTGAGAPGGNAASAGVAAARGGRGFESPVQRKPGESPQAYRTRALGIQSKYTSSKAALDRGEFATAAAGFDAILKDEPAFLDAPQLLVKAREGQRAAAQGTARDLLEAGNKLDASGDGAGALQKYDQAKAADPTLPGVDDAIKRVRDRMRAQGNDAFKRGRQYDALGRSADALKEYEKAAQMLAADDPNGKIARDRVEQLKK